MNCLRLKQPAIKVHKKHMHNCVTSPEPLNALVLPLDSVAVTESGFLWDRSFHYTRVDLYISSDNAY